MSTQKVKTMAEAEKEHIVKVLYEFDKNKTKAAKALKISLKTLYNKLKVYEMEQEFAHPTKHA